MNEILSLIDFCYNLIPMEKIHKKYICLLLFTLLTACAVPPEEPPESILQKLQPGIATLPGAVVGADGFFISYPDENLFATGAVLPMPGGLAVLDPLIDLLLKNQKVRGVGVVRSSGHNDEYDLLLATKRAEILNRIFRNRGLTDGRLELSVEAAAGAPFELQLQAISPDTSAGVKQ